MLESSDSASNKIDMERGPLIRVLTEYEERLRFYAEGLSQYREISTALSSAADNVLSAVRYLENEPRNVRLEHSLRRTNEA